ncbi:RNA-directed DNA polymerase, eukaryota, reverse transcriptase zinc-binding domain protein, partial [Tanacetum coccineum]
MDGVLSQLTSTRNAKGINSEVTNVSSSLPTLKNEKYRKRKATKLGKLWPLVLQINDAGTLAALNVIRLIMHSMQENEELNKEPNKQENGKVGVKTYVNVIVIAECDKQLNTIPTEFDSNENEVVVFDEVLVAKGSKRWEMTVAWTTKCISALASRVGKPMVIDVVTATMCKNKLGKVRYARVLVKVSAQKPLPDDIEIVYKNGLNEVTCRKNVKENKKQMYGEGGFVKVKNRKTGSKREKVMRQTFKPNTQPPRTGNNKQVKSKEKQSKQIIEEDDVCQDDSRMAQCMKGDEIREMILVVGVLRVLVPLISEKKVKKCIEEEALSICIVIETHLKAKNLQRIGDFIFEDWEWISTMQFCDKRMIVGKKAWIMLGDMNVTLAPNENSFGSSFMTADMNEFRDCINNIEMEVVASFGLFNTWTKNLFKVKAGNTSGVLKKLDRIMGNESFIANFGQAHAIFLPYLISDHCSTVLIFPKAIQAKNRAFEFPNFVADKEEFLPLLKEEESIVLQEYVVAMKDEEKLLYQKVKVKWLSVGDRNNAYFHKVLKSRNHKCRINTIHDGYRNKYEGDDVAEQFDKLSEAEVNEMARDNIVGEDVCKAVKEFFVNEKLLTKINSTMITLIPKIQSLDKVTNFRLVACCNVLYKCISKIITERMKKFRGKLVDKNQSAFVPNMHIQDNILLSQELLKGYERKEGPKRVVIKIDIRKAYDTVNWIFLECILHGFGFHKRMVDWIIICVSTTSFSICVNGERFGYFKGGRGLRQGSAHGSALVDDDDDDSPVKEMSPVKAKKPSKRASKAYKNDTKDKEPLKVWTMAEEIALCRAWCDVLKNGKKGNAMKAKGFWDAVIKYLIKETGSVRGITKVVHACWNLLKDHQGWLEVEMPSVYKNKKGRKKSKTSKTTSGSTSGGFNFNNEADEFEEETQEHRPMGRDRSKAKKKASTSSLEGSFSFVDLVADKFLNIKSTKWGKMQEQQDFYLQLKNWELDIHEATRKEATELKRAKLEIQRRTLELAEKKKPDNDILFYNSEINLSLPAIRQQKLHEMNDEIKETYNLYY